MVRSHRCSAEEGTSAPLLSKTAEEYTLQHTPTLHYAMHCTLTKFNWTTRTHYTNTTIYLLPLDTMQRTSMTLRIRPM